MIVLVACTFAALLLAVIIVGWLGKILGGTKTERMPVEGPKHEKPPANTEEKIYDIWQRIIMLVKELQELNIQAGNISASDPLGYSLDNAFLRLLQLFKEGQAAEFERLKQDSIDIIKNDINDHEERK